MSTRAKILLLVDRELSRLQALPSLGDEDLAALQSLARTAAVGEGLDVGEEEDPDEDTAELEARLARG